MIQQTKFIYSPFGRALEQQTKTTEDQGGEKKKNQMKNLMNFFKNMIIILKKMKENMKYLN